MPPSSSIPPAAPGGAPPGEAEVIVDFLFERGLLFVSVRNLGGRPALKVSVSFDRPFRGLGGTREMTSLPLFANIEFLAPGREITTLVDTTAGYFARKEPTKLAATVSYRTPSGGRRQTKIAHDLAIYRDLAYVEGGTFA